MLIRTYRAKNLKEALGRVKEELGDQATILSARSIRTGLLSSQMEVTAAPPDPSPAMRPRPEPQAEVGQHFNAQQMSKMLSPLRLELRALHAELRALQLRAPTPSGTDVEAPRERKNVVIPAGPLAELQRRLEASGMRAALGERVARAVAALLREEEGDLNTGRSSRPAKSASTTKDNQQLDSLALRAIAQDLHRAMPIESRGSSRPIALVGPPGVGKTTTLAKIAARAALLHGREVGLIAADDEGIVGAQAIEELARCLGVSCARASDPASLRDAAQSLRHCDIILVDLAGQGPRDAAGLARLNEKLAAVEADVVLCLNADLRPLEIDANLAGFAASRPSALILCKLDQAIALGALYDAAAIADLPVMYLTTGRRIPDDIEEATPERIASLVMGLNLN